MNKFLRFSFWLILLITAFILILAFIEPRDVTITRSILIRAPKEPVFAQIVNFRNWDNWNIIVRRDSGVHVTFSGQDGTPGSTYHWAGDEHVTGEGEMKNTAVEGTTMHYTFTVVKPGEMLADCAISARDTAGLTRVTWTFHKHFAFIANAALIVFDLDKYIGGDFDAALANLKQYVEKNTVYVAPIQVQEVNYPGHLFAGIRQVIDISGMSAFFTNSYAFLSKIPALRPAGNPASITYSWDTVTRRADIMAVLPVADSSARLKDAVYLSVPAATSYMAVHKGGYQGLEAVHGALMKYAAAKGRTPALKIEEYTICAPQEPDSNKWVTNIYYLLQ